MNNTQKTSFYRTFEEKELAGVVDYFYNEFIGGSENAKMDGNEYTAWTEKELMETIKAMILKEKRFLRIENSNMLLEAKHVRFMGEKRVTEIVEHRVQFRHKKDGRWDWE